MVENITGLSLDLIVHPGESIKELLEESDMTQDELAIRTGYSSKHISEVLSGKKDISSKFANALEYVFDIPTEFWINLQGIYDKQVLELEKVNNITDNEYGILEQLKEVVKYFNKIDLIDDISNKALVVLNLRKIFKLNNLMSIPNLPLQQVAFRGAKSTVNIYVLYAWQKLCESLTDKVVVHNKFDKEKLKTKYDDIKETMFLNANEMVVKLKEIFLECGIVFEVVKHFAGAPVQGFIKKKDDRVILCMTIRQAFSDIFWFTLFHEIGHIINEDFEDKYIDYSIIDSEIERRADEFAKNRLINEDEYKAFMDAKTHEIKDVEEFAKAQKVIPSIVIGRMQRDLNDYSFLMKYKHKYVWG